MGGWFRPGTESDTGLLAGIQLGLARTTVSDLGPVEKSVRFEFGYLKLFNDDRNLGAGDTEMLSVQFTIAQF